MRSSYIATSTPDSLAEESGYVMLGTVDGLAYVHFAPETEAQQIVFPNGDLTNPQLDGEGMVGIFERSRPSFEADAKVLYDPTPEPFRWDNFADAFPALAKSPVENADGQPLPSPLMPHQWAGE